MRLKGRLIGQYRLMHDQRPHRYSRGSTVRKYIGEIAKLVAEIPTESILDYGSGAGTQYTVDRIHEGWGGPMPALFDPAIPGIDDLPEDVFDGVICTGVLEHIPEPELDLAIGNLAKYARRWALIVVGTGPSPRKRLPDGRNVHVTIRPATWWQERIEAAFGDRDIRLWLGYIAS